MSWLQSRSSGRNRCGVKAGASGACVPVTEAVLLGAGAVVVQVLEKAMAEPRWNGRQGPRGGAWACGGDVERAAVGAAERSIPSRQLQQQGEP